MFVRWAACFVFVPRVCVVGNVGRGEWERCVCLERAKLCLCVFADGRVGEFLASKGLVDRIQQEFGQQVLLLSVFQNVD